MAGDGDSDLQIGLDLPALLFGNETSHTRGRGGLDKDSLLTCEEGLSVEYLLIADCLDQATGFVACREGLLGRGRVADSDRARHGLGLQNWMSEHQGSRTVRLKAPHPWGSCRLASRHVLHITAPVRRDIPGVTNRDHM